MDFSVCESIQNRWEKCESHLLPGRVLLGAEGKSFYSTANSIQLDATDSLSTIKGGSRVGKKTGHLFLPLPRNWKERERYGKRNALSYEHTLYITCFMVTRPFLSKGEYISQSALGFIEARVEVHTATRLPPWIQGRTQLPNYGPESRQ